MKISKCMIAANLAEFGRLWAIEDIAIPTFCIWKILKAKRCDYPHKVCVKLTSQALFGVVTVPLYEQNELRGYLPQRLEAVL